MNRIDSQLHKLKPYDAKDKSVRSPLHLSLSLSYHRLLCVLLH